MPGSGDYYVSTLFGLIVGGLTAYVTNDGLAVASGAFAALVAILVITFGPEPKK